MLRFVFFVVTFNLSSNSMENVGNLDSSTPRTIQQENDFNGNNSFVTSGVTEVTIPHQSHKPREGREITEECTRMVHQETEEKTCPPETSHQLEKYKCCIDCLEQDKGINCVPQNCTQIHACLPAFRRHRIYLNLHNSNITALPSNVFNGLSELSVLQLSNNRLVGLTYNIFSALVNLTYLDIGGNYLTVLPENIFKNSLGLTNLYMDKNNMIYLPNSLFNRLSKLTHLDLYKNKITFLPYNVFNGLTSLKFLSLRSNNILTLPPNVFNGLSELVWLDLYNNNLVLIPNNVLSGLSKLRSLFLNNNNIIRLPGNLFRGLSELQYLDLSHNNLLTIPFNLFKGLSKLTDLYLHGNDLVVLPYDVFTGSNSGGHQNLWNNDESVVLSAVPLNLLRVDLAGNALTHLPQLPRALTEINIRGNIIEVTENMFAGLNNLTKLLTDNLFVCCVKPTPETECFEPLSSLQSCHRNPGHCKYKGHAISSCYALISSYILKACLWIIGISAVIGNLAVIFYRIFLDRENITKSYSVFTLNLAMSDLLMGIYLLIIGIVDAYYDGIYAWNDQKWRKSVLCTMAGVLSSVSSEMSTFLILMVSIDRLIIIMFPLSRFSRPSISWILAPIASLCCWVISVTLAIIPTVTLQSYFKGEFYSQSSVCLALPLTMDIQSGTEYSFALFVCFNSIIFAVIVVCQICICKSIRTSGRRVTSSQNRQRETSVAITLFFVVVTDFCCWCPIGIMGVASRYGVEIPGGVYAWVMVFVLPINAAINPFLYTASAIWRRRQKVDLCRMEDDLFKNIQNNNANIITPSSLTCLKCQSTTATSKCTYVA